MVATIGGMYAELGTNVIEFKRDMKQAADAVKTSQARMNKNIHKINTSFKSASKSLKSFKVAAFGAAGAITAVAGSFTIAKKFIEANDAIAKTADKLGITTNLLQEYQFAAQLSGVSTNTLDMAVQRFTRRAAEAANGTGEAKDALRELGVQLRDTNGNMLPTEQLMNQVADGLATVHEPAERLRLAFKLFDSEGVAMINMLKGGASGLKEMRDEAHKTGGVIDESILRKSENSNDALFKLGQTLKVEMNTSLAKISPSVVAIGESLASLMPIITKLTQGILWVFEKLAKSIEFVVSGITKSIEYIGEKVTKVVDNVKGAFGDNGIAETVKKDAVAFNESAALYKDGITVYQNEVDMLEKAQAQLKRAVEVDQRKAELSTKAHEELAKAKDNVAKANDKTKESNKDLYDKTDAIAGAKNALKEYAKYAKNVGEQVSDAVGSAISGLEDTMVDFVTTGKLNFKDLANSILADMARIMMRQAIVAPLMQGLGTAMGVPMFHTGGVVGAPAQMTSVSSPNTFRNAPRFHTGGRVGGLGPDEVPAVLLKGERVLNREETAAYESSAGGSIVVNNTFQISTGVQDTVRHEIQSLMPQIQKQTTNAVEVAISRGGNLSKQVRARR